VRELVGTVSGFLYETFTEIWAGVADWLKSDGPGVDWAGVAGSIVDAVFDGIGAAWNAYSDFVMGLLRGLFGDIPNEIFEAGENLIQRLQDGAAQKFDDFLSWVGGIPGRIVDAIGSIDLSSIIDFGEPPRWLKWLMGDEETARPAAPPPPSQAELGTLDANQRAAAETLMAARAAGDLPTPEYLNDLSDYAGQLRAEMANVQAQIDQIDENGPQGATLTAPMQRDLRQLQEELVSVEAELQTGRERADEVTEALRVLGETEAEPEINTTSIDRALDRVRVLRSEMRALEQGANVPAQSQSQAEIDGQRARGGRISRGGTYLVGEEGPELITASRNGYVHSSGEAPKATSSQEDSQPASIEVHVGQITVSPTIATTERVDPAELSLAISAAMREQVRETFRGVFADTSMRFA
jgi:cob(I)alamin adenosyltransferase